MTHFKQFFDDVSCTYTYFIADSATKKAVIIDPVLEHVDSYMEHIQFNNFELLYVLETHVHADHITGGSVLRKKTGAKTAVSLLCGATCADHQLNDGDVIEFGSQQSRVLLTPGHTGGSLSFIWQDRIFTGDALLIGGCGRTDFQAVDAATLYAQARDPWGRSYDRPACCAPPDGLGPGAMGPGKISQARSPRQGVLFSLYVNALCLSAVLSLHTALIPANS